MAVTGEGITGEANFSSEKALVAVLVACLIGGSSQSVDRSLAWLPGLGLSDIQPPVDRSIWFRAFLHFGVTPIVGAIVGYWIGKRRGFRTQVTKWRETHRSIDETDEESSA